MPMSHEPRSVLDAAEEAAAAGDYTSAESLLREAARLQEAALGQFHPELANTLNNLGVVCEIINQPAEAERCYRRACAIAAATLDPEDPFVLTSRKNLRDFCEARGKVIEPPIARQSVAVAQAPASAFPIIAASLAGLVLVMLVGTLWLRSSGQADSPPVAATPLPPSAVPAERSAEPIPAAKEVLSSNRGPLPAARLERAATASTLTLAAAMLCQDLSTKESQGLSPDWRCNPVGRPVDSGPIFFYTRLKSPRDTTVQHRWYRDDRLYQAVDLKVGANQRDGYRTYSRYTANSRSTGNWRVELRSSDGMLLKEERFTIK